MNATLKKTLALLYVIALVALLLPSPRVSAAAADFDIPGGHFFTQTGGGGDVGFAVVDDGGARFWTEFQRLGGVAIVGYPLSQRFAWDGFTVQVMQKGVLQWRPEVGRAYFVNVFDRLSEAGKDDWLLTVRSTPKPLDAGFDAGRSWNEIVAARQALLDANPAMRSAYRAVPDPLNLYGLPTSPVVDNGNHYAIRLQRAVIQQWKVAVPWAKVGEVTVANGGEIGKETGVFPADALRPVAAPTVPADRPVASSRGGDRTGTPAEVALALVNEARAASGIAPLTIDPALQRAAQAHADYYVQNYGDRSLAGMGLHYETAGRPGFTGVSWAERARAAGYGGGSVDENAGLVGNPQRMVEWCLGTINHRQNMLHPSAVHLAYGMATKPAIDIMNVGFSSNRPSVDLPAVFPGDGQRGVPTSSQIAETPDPAPGVPRPLGYPLSVSFHVRDNVQFTNWGLTDPSGQPLQVYTSQKAWLRTMAIIPARPLQPGTTYTAHVGGTVNGQPFTKTWSFTTR